MDELTCWHESGHAVAAHALGREVVLVTAVAGERSEGCTLVRARLVAANVPDVDAPVWTWGGRWLEHLTGDALYVLAGDVAEGLFGLRKQARLPEPVAELAVADLALAGQSTADEQEQAAVAVGDPALPSDAETLTRQLRAMFGSDVTRAAAWLRWIEEEARALLLHRADSVRRLQALLAEHGVIGQAAAAKVLEGER